MGLLSPKNTARTPTHLLPTVTALAVFSVTAIFLYKVDDFAFQTKTVAGHNLDRAPLPLRTSANKPKSLLKRYPGMVPDVDMMFDCMDKPRINTTEHRSMPLPLFRYCTNEDHYDIPFPDWSFWGWPETNLRPWDEEFRDIKRGSQRISWSRKVPRAYWKGNPDVNSPVRLELLKCNHSRMWGAQIMRQDWAEEARIGYGKSKLSNQCDYQIKVDEESSSSSFSKDGFSEFLLRVSKTVELKLMLNALLYNTTQAYYKCPLSNHVCTFKLFLLRRNFAVLTSPVPKEASGSVPSDDRYPNPPSHGSTRGRTTAARPRLKRKLEAAEFEDQNLGGRQLLAVEGQSNDGTVSHFSPTTTSYPHSPSGSLSIAPPPMDHHDGKTTTETRSLKRKLDPESEDQHEERKVLVVEHRNKDGNGNHIQITYFARQYRAVKY
ncbi:hypothetical protein CJ030_MR1G019927 [Morella rubra]|uniref:Glycosyl transferase CAP10 domain-containing protein n=1 Tax=Morella rubra TaxID=262757 RepID=A0A6A1WKS9_9ROSI|nr:hypothetical protein CJ030_MR1G019927 [Morella rubra]